MAFVRLPATFWVVVVATFVTYVGLGVILPVRVLYAQQVGLSLFEIGLMAASFFLSMFVFQIPAGYLADRLGRRRTMLAGIGIHTVTSLAYLATDSPAVFIGLRVVEGLGAAGVTPAARALIADVVAEERRGRAYGIYRAAFQGSLLAGPALGGLLAGATGFELSYIISSATRALGFILVLVFLKEPPIGGRGTRRDRQTPPGAESSRDAQPAAPAERDRCSATPRSAALGVLFKPPLLAAYVVSGGTIVSTGLDHSIWSIYLQDIGAPLGFIGVTFTIRAAIALLATPWAGVLADRWNRIAIVAIAGLLWTGASLALAYLTDLLSITLLVVVQGAATALLMPALDRYLADESPGWGRGQIQAIFQATSVGAAGLFALVCGPLYQLEPGLPFLVLAVIELVTVCGGALAMVLAGQRRAEPN